MLEKLNEIQNRDLKIDTLEEEKKQTPPELIEARIRKTDLEERLAAKRREHEALRQRVSSSELELRALEERRKSASEASLRAGSSKEAAQFQNQELQFATRVQELEEDTLPLMEQLDVLAAEVAELEEALAELEPMLAELAAQEEARLEEIDDRMGSIRDEREGLAGAVDDGLLRQYEQVRRARRGVGLVEIAGQTCGGCTVRLPIHVIQKARRGTGVTRCPSCGRILWPKE